MTYLNFQFQPDLQQMKKWTEKNLKRKNNTVNINFVRREEVKLFFDILKRARQVYEVQ